MAEESADRIFYGGDILTMDENNPTAEALAVKGESIVAVGKLDEVFQLEGPTTEVIYLNKQTLLPGFIEPHQHAIQLALCHCLYVTISGYCCNSYEEVKEVMLKEIAKADPTADPLPWCIFFGWDPELIPNMPELSANFLDTAFSSEIAIAVMGQSGHVAWVNHKAFEVAGIDNTIQDEDGGVFVKENGELTGQLFEEPAIMKVIGYAPTPSVDELVNAIKVQLKDYASRGFTTVTDLAYMPNELIDPILAAESKTVDCPVRLGLYRMVHGPEPDEQARPLVKFRPSCCRFVTLPSYKQQRGVARKVEVNFEPNDKLWEVGVKMVADGSPHCGTAAVREPFFNTHITEILGFPDPPSYGNLSYTSKEVYDTVKFFHQKGTQVAIHAHGERAVDQVISVYEKVSAECKTPVDMRHRIEHLGLATEDQIARAGKINIALSFFVGHLYFYAKSYTESIFGAERTNRWAPLSLATKHNVRWTIHQDQPTYPGPPLPFANMKTAVTRTQRYDNDTVYGPEYRVSIHEALRAYTINAAWQIHRDDQLGSLTVNKKADLVILSHNPYNVDPMKLKEIEVVDTFIGGRSNNVSKPHDMTFPDKTVKVYSKQEQVGMKAC